MAAFVSMLRTTRDNAREQGRVLAGFVRLEAQRWRRYVTARARSLSGRARRSARYATSTTRELLAPKAFERQILVRVDGTLRALDGKVTQRLTTLTSTKTRPAKRSPAKRKSLPSRPSGTTLINGGRKQAS